MSATNSHAVQAILTAGLLCGVLDGISAILISLPYGISAARMFRGIAAGVLGPAAAARGGSGTALVGVALHFVIAVGASAVFYAASRVLPALLDRALMSGVLYGIAVHLFMQFVVLPLSAIGRRPFVASRFLLVLMVHIVVVGPTIALTVRRYSR
jgi:hypothetical protein